MGEGRDVVFMGHTKRAASRLTGDLMLRSLRRTVGRGTIYAVGEGHIHNAMAIVRILASTIIRSRREPSDLRLRAAFASRRDNAAPNTRIKIK